MKLYHFSEEPNIQVFEPRKLESRPDEAARVWAIDEFHAPHYYFPRECPRICIWPKEDTLLSDIQYFFGQSGVHRMMAIEAGWMERLRNCQLYRYSFESEYFTLDEPNAGYYISTQAVRPILIERMDDLLRCIVQTNIEFRMTPSLTALKESVLASTVNFSMIRMRNAIE